MAKFDYTCSQCKNTDEIDTKYDEGSAHTWIRRHDKDICTNYRYL